MSNNIRGINMYAGIADLNNKVLAKVDECGLSVQLTGDVVYIDRVIIESKGSPKKLIGTDIQTKRIIIKAESTNSGNVFVCVAGGNHNNGYPLEASAEIELFVSNSSLIYMDTATNGNAVRYIIEV